MLNLEGKKGLVLGIANDQSIAYGIAKVLYGNGAELALTYQTEKTKKYTEHLATTLEASLFELCDVLVDEDLDRLFAKITATWGKLDFVIHCVAFAPKEALWVPVAECPVDGFNTSMDISVHSFMKVAKYAAPLMIDGGSFITLTYDGSTKVRPNYNVMGVCKAALESSVRYMACELGSKNISVNAISASPIRTRAASGIAGFDALAQGSIDRSPMHRLVTQEEVGYTAAFLVTNEARAITGQTIFVDAGSNLS